MKPAKAREKTHDILRQVGSDPSAYQRFPHEFSGGQRQRIAIARALMFDPEVIIADKAVSALACRFRRRFLNCSPVSSASGIWR